MPRMQGHVVGARQDRPPCAPPFMPGTKEEAHTFLAERGECGTLARNLRGVSYGPMCKINLHVSATWGDGTHNADAQ